MKKTFVAFAVVAFALASCTNDSPAENKTENAQEKADEMTDEMMRDLDDAGDSINYAADTLKNDMEAGAEDLQETTEEM